jgi:hypothetical protein
MKLTAEDYRQSYRALSDEEFLAINRDELVEVARRCYDAELKRRQLESPVPTEETPEQDEGPRETPPMPEGEEVVQAALVTSLERATYAQQMLMDADIPCEINQRPYIPFRYAHGAIALMVPASCVEMARELLAHNLTEDNQLLVRRWLEQEWTPEGRDLNDFNVTVADIFGDAGKVAARLSVEGSDPGTGAAVKLGAVAIIHLSDGRIGDHWVNFDS